MFRSVNTSGAASYGPEGLPRRPARSHVEPLCQSHRGKKKMTQNSLYRLCSLLLATGIGCASPGQNSHDAGAGDVGLTTDAMTSDVMGSDGGAPDLVPDTA